VLTGRRLTLTDRARVVQRGAGASWWGIVQWGNAFPNATLHPHPHHVVQCTLSCSAPCLFMHCTPPVWNCRAMGGLGEKNGSTRRTVPHYFFLTKFSFNWNGLR